MKLIYIHHAHRNKGNPPTQEDDITKLGVKDAKIVAKFLRVLNKRGVRIKAIYSSPFKRCIKTAKIINKKLKVEIIEEKRFNEAGSVPSESWLDVQKRTRKALYDIVCKYKDDDAVVCVTSGVNVIAFIFLVCNLLPSDKAPYIGIPSCSPMIFNITKEDFKDYNEN